MFRYSTLPFLRTIGPRTCDAHHSTTAIPQRPADYIICGGTGLIGTELCRQLLEKDRGHELNVAVLSRNPERSSSTWKEKRFPGEQRIQLRKWDAHTGTGWSDLIGANSVIVNLCGENLGSTPLWTEAFQRRVVDSRVDSVGAVRHAIQQAATKPLAVLQGGAVGIYPDAGDLLLVDDHPSGNEPTLDMEARAHLSGRDAGTEFRRYTCQQLEEATRRAAEQTGVSYTVLRTGVVLSGEDGVLPRMQLGALTCSRFGSGQAFVPWIHVKDAAAAIAFLAEQPPVAAAGCVDAVNIVAPHSATNAELMKLLTARWLGRLANWYPRLPIPEAVLRLSGPISSLFLDSQRVVPTKLTERNFPFTFATIEEAVRAT